MNVYGKLAVARGKFSNAHVKKTGVNKYAEYKYYTPEDIKPVKQKIFNELGLVDIFNITRERAWITLVNIDNSDEIITFECPVSRDESMIKNPVQKDGAEQTYYERYLNKNMLDICESDEIEAVTGKPENDNVTPITKKSTKPATTEERQEVKGELINKDGEATKTQITGLKNGLKKLRAKDDSYEDYVTQCVKKMKIGLTKTEAENLLIEIGNKVAE